jgi:hypothetical protein
MYQQYSNLDNTVKVWYTHINGCIVKSYIHPVTNRIIQEKMPYNHPSNYTKSLDEYFRYKLK